MRKESGSNNLSIYKETHLCPLTIVSISLPKSYTLTTIEFRIRDTPIEKSVLSVIVFLTAPQRFDLERKVERCFRVS
jgi:hypothetical protein